MHKKIILGICTVISIGVIYILFCPPVNSVRIYVSTPLGESLNIRSNQNNTINDLKKAIEDITALPAQRQELSLGDVKLDDDEKIRNYKMKSGAIIKLNISKDHDHSYGELTTIKKNTCENAGQQKQVCDCGEESIVNVPKLQHIKSEWIETKKPTQDETGVKKKFCTLCQKEFDERIIPKIVSNLKDNPKIPQTGDETNVVAICVIPFFALICLGVLCYTNLREKKQERNKADI